MSNQAFSRRAFMRGMLGAAGTAAAPFALNMAAVGAAAAAASDYKALVCLFMVGGNDHYNTLLATDPESWSEYRRLRDTEDTLSIALAAPGAAGGVLPLSGASSTLGRPVALHPQLGRLRDLFTAGRAAAVANVGTLVAPLTKAQYLNGSVALPPKLFSHNDQQAVWQSNHAEGGLVGWGGRMSDLLAASNANTSFACVSAAGNTTFLSGNTLRQYQVDAAGAVPVNGIGGRVLAANFQLRPLVAGPQSNLLQAAHAGVMARAIDLQVSLSGAMAAAGSGGVPNPDSYINPNTGVRVVNPLAVQLQTVARVIAGRNTLGMKRQVFFVSLGTFDTHDNQAKRHADLLARLDHGVAYFDNLMASLMGANLRQQVTLFTASDFGRTLTSNGDGTDHGWGSHHFVVGGAVKGNKVYGTLPPVGLGHANDIGYGALLPSLAVEQYGATLARWFGVADGQLSTVFPNLGNFSTGNLGFMA